MVLSPSTLESTSYSQQGWNAVHTANMEKLNAYLKTLVTAAHGLGTTAIVDNAGTQADPAAITAEILTDNSGGSASQIVAAISGSGADAGINDNLASLADEINKLKNDLTAVRTALVGVIDYADTLKTTVNALLTELRVTGGCGVLAD